MVKLGFPFAQEAQALLAEQALLVEQAELAEALQNLVRLKLHRLATAQVNPRYSVSERLVTSQLLGIETKAQLFELLDNAPKSTTEMINGCSEMLTGRWAVPASGTAVPE